jgi:hypothetical protein
MERIAVEMEFREERLATDWMNESCRREDRETKKPHNRDSAGLRWELNTFCTFNGDCPGRSSLFRFSTKVEASSYIGSVTSPASMQYAPKNSVLPRGNGAIRLIPSNPWLDCWLAGLQALTLVFF